MKKKIKLRIKELLKNNNFLKNAKPLILPSYKIHSLVTSRLEKYRKETEEWLQKYNIEYENLIMLDLPSKEERQRLNAHASHKLNYYKKTNTDLFIESDYYQAIKISKGTGKVVFCVDKNIIITPTMHNVLIKDRRTFFNRVKSNIFNAIPEWIKFLIKPIYRMLIKK